MAPTDLYTLSLHDALPIWGELGKVLVGARGEGPAAGHDLDDVDAALGVLAHRGPHAFDGRFCHPAQVVAVSAWRSEEHTSELQSLTNLVCRLLLEKKN